MATKDTHTYTNRVKHGNLHESQYNEIKKWIRDNCNGDGMISYEYTYFKRADDALAFKIRFQIQ